MRDMDLETTQDEVQKALGKVAGVPVEALKVKAMPPTNIVTQIAIVTMSRSNALGIIKSEKVRIGWITTRIR